MLITLVVVAACVVYSGAHYRWGFSEGILILWSGGVALFSVPIPLKNEASPSLAAKCMVTLMWPLLSLLTIRSRGIGSTLTPWLVGPPLIDLRESLAVGRTLRGLSGEQRTRPSLGRLDSRSSCERSGVIHRTLTAALWWSYNLRQTAFYTTYRESVST